MEAGEWTHAQDSLPSIISLVRAFLDILFLASGIQRSASPAFWRSQDVSRALKWASLLEQIMAKISDYNDQAESLNRDLQSLMLEMSYPEGLPRLSCEVLEEAKRLLFHAMSYALGPGSGQIESLVAAVRKDEKDLGIVLEQIRKRMVVTESTKSVIKALNMAFSMPTMSKHIGCTCHQWRQDAISYLLKGTTQYKLSGAAVLFKCSIVQWKTALQKLQDQSNTDKLADIVELCCLFMSMHSRSILLTRLLEPCDKMSCLSEAYKMWHPENHTMEGTSSKEIAAVEAFLYGLTENNNKIWWSVPPILVAAALTKGSVLFAHYNAQLSNPIEGNNEVPLCSNRIKRYAGEVLDTQISKSDERKWCVWFVQSMAADEEDLNQRRLS